MALNPRLEHAYGEQTSEGTRAFYDDWAATYEADLLDDLGYAAPRECVALFRQTVPDTSARIIEAGCGSGLAGALLSEAGYSHIDGADLSPGMLDIARRRGVYRHLSRHDLLEPLTAEAPYDAALCVGVFSFGPLFARHIKHILAVLSPGAPLVLSVNGKAWRELAWAAEMEEAQAEDGFEIVERREIRYLVNENIDGHAFVLRRA